MMFDVRSISHLASSSPYLYCRCPTLASFLFNTHYPAWQNEGPSWICLLPWMFARLRRKEITRLESHHCLPRLTMLLSPRDRRTKETFQDRRTYTGLPGKPSGCTETSQKKFRANMPQYSRPNSLHAVTSIRQYDCSLPLHLRRHAQSDLICPALKSYAQLQLRYDK
ncbi:uncharacterized protein B0I36DRAFT_333975 [Microdochium trichocladiopsis]|uniref:Uncharacterized protein n=1 Tax=Microdochium trichocladiopsis TaxID=1682393 RepID=A0A9P8XY73_9PEZI|nr:uncharacterized protein B0I36DRAFT_333975 [Microdochium trichocladiopsis]KAH7021195.1 hypothetical protein B0I36DRAFT_333975 [Microdochium trichocladiopsis]